MELFRYLAGAAISAGILSFAAAEPDRVPVAVVPFLVAIAATVLSSVISAVAVIAALRARFPGTVLRSAFVIWCTGIAGTVLATIVVIVNAAMSPGLFAAFFFALAVLAFAKPLPSSRLRAIRTDHP